MSDDDRGMLGAKQKSRWKSALGIAAIIAATALCVGVFIGAERWHAERERKRQRLTELNYRLSNLNKEKKALAQRLDAQRLSLDDLREFKRNESDEIQAERRELRAELDKSLVSRFLSLFR